MGKVNYEAYLLPVPSFALTTALSNVIKAFQNPVWAEQARQRLKQINMLIQARSLASHSR